VYFDDHRVGVVKGDRVIDASPLVDKIPHVEREELMSHVIADWQALKPRFADLVASESGRPLSEVRLRAPLPRPRNIVAMVVNYREEHAIAMGQEKPAPGERTKPLPINAFHKSPNTIIGPGDTMVLPDVPATIFEGEAELAVVIGPQRATRVRAADASKYVFGYMNFIDGSARGLPPERNVFFQMKSPDTFAPIGPWIVTADEIADDRQIAIRLWNNGQLMQDYSTEHIAYDIPTCIEFVTRTCTLEPGDMLALGTNHAGLNPFQDGDQIAMECTGCGRLEFGVRDELKRTWTRERRIDRYLSGRAGTTPQLTGKYAPQK